MKNPSQGVFPTEPRQSHVKKSSWGGGVDVRREKLPSRYMW